MSKLPAPRLVSPASQLVELLANDATQATVAEVRIGLVYTALRLVDGGLGLGMTFRDELGACCSTLAGVSPMAGRSAADFLPLLASADRVEAALGLACANALIARLHALREPAALAEGDLLGQLDLRPDDRVGMVGDFAPMVPAVRGRVAELIIFERVHAPTETLRPAAEAHVELPGCDVALITATTLINHTLDRLLAACAGCREVALLGASTPLLADAFEGSPVTLLSGVQLPDPALVLQTVSEGGGMRGFKRSVRKVNLRLGR